MDLLARREHSRLELTRKLTGRVEHPAHLDQALAELMADNLLSDERFCEAFVYSRRNGGYGPVRVKAELRERGIGDELIGRFLLADDDLWQQKLIEVVEKKYGPVQESSPRDRAKQQRYLLQRGYNFEQIKRVLSG